MKPKNMANIKDTFTIIVDVQVKADRIEEFNKLIDHDAKASVELEPGCHWFNVLRDLKDDTKFTFYEVYADEAAFKHYQTTEHFAQWNQFKESGGFDVTNFKHLKSHYFIN